jgi:hypothetical protein
MAAREEGRTQSAGRDEVGRRRSIAARVSTETKASSKTTEFFAMLAVIVGILVAAADIGPSGVGHPDQFTGSEAWLYVSIVSVGYMISRGLAKSGSREFYDDRD